MTNQTTNQQDLNKVLWESFNSSRSTIDAGIYKNYALTMLFYKYISDKYKKQYGILKERYGQDETRIQQKMKLDRFYLPPKTSFDSLYQQTEDDTLGELINKALRQIEDHNKEKLEGIFGVDFNAESILGKTQQRNKMLRDLMQDFNKIDLSQTDEDVIGNAYMFLIEKFGADAGKKAGEFFTVRSVSRLLARLSMPKPGDRISDPAMGSGGLLLSAGEEVEKQGSKDYMLYGQESIGSTYQLARMNMFLYGQDSSRLEWGDTLNNPLLVEDDKLMKYDVIVANPPFSLKKWGAENAAGDKYNRFWRGVPPKDKGDFAFILHMVETAKPKSGRVAVIVPHGVLFRGGGEGKIRQSLLEDNLIDAVIGLPAGLFQNTGIPVAILIIDRSREQGGKNQDKQDILFIEASKEFVPGKAQNTLGQENADKIFDNYVSKQEIEKFSRVVSPGEIKENDYNLKVTRYVDTFEEEEAVDIQANLQELEKLNPEIEKLEAKIKEYLKKLNIT